MSTTHDDLIEAAREAIQAVHGDTTVSRKQTHASLEELSGDIDVMLDALLTEMRADAEDDDE